MNTTNKENLAGELQQNLQLHRRELFLADRVTRKSTSACVGIITDHPPYLVIYKEGFSIYSPLFYVLLYNEAPVMYHRGGTIGPLTPMFMKLDDLIEEGDPKLRVVVGTRNVLEDVRDNVRLEKPVQEFYRYVQIASPFGNP